MLSIIIITILTALIVIFVVFSILTANMCYFCAFPRTSAYGDPNKLRFIHLKGFLFVISNDLFCNDVVFSTEVTNMSFQYNLKPILMYADVLNNKKPLNIEMLDNSTGEQYSYSVPHSSKGMAIKFFKNYRELMQRISQHEKNSKKS